MAVLLVYSTVKILYLILPSITILQELILNWCWELTDKGVEEVILYCHRLEVLSLVGVVRISESILVDIGVALPDLKLLNLEQCPNIDDTNLVKILSYLISAFYYPASESVFIIIVFVVPAGFPPAANLSTRWVQMTSKLSLCPCCN